MSCDYSGPFDGGTWLSPTVVDPEVTGGTVTNTELANVELTSNIAVDDAVAEKLANFLKPYMGATISAKKPGSTLPDENGALPTRLIGSNRDMLLGTPDAYIEFGDMLVPAYRPGA